MELSAADTKKKEYLSSLASTASIILPRLLVVVFVPPTALKVPTWQNKNVPWCSRKGLSSEVKKLYYIDWLWVKSIITNPQTITRSWNINILTCCIQWLEILNWNIYAYLWYYDYFSFYRKWPVCIFIKREENVWNSDVKVPSEYGNDYESCFHILPNIWSSHIGEKRETCFSPHSDLCLI